MGDLRIGSAVASDLAGAMTDYSVDSESTDGAGESKELRWQNKHWTTDYGYYLHIPEFKRAVDTIANWTMGGGYEADEITTMLLDSVKGNGKDSFNSILKNMIRCKTISGDSFAEVIRDDNGMLVNIKPLDPSSIVVVQNRAGRIVRYEQAFKGRPNKSFLPSEIFHLSHDRIADSICGTRIIISLEPLILMRNEAMADWKKVLHRLVKPMFFFHLDTDDTTEIAKYKKDMDAAWADGENFYVPKDVVVPELVSVAANATLNPIAWIDSLNDAFFQAVGVPQILFGNAKGFTDASGKIVYLSYEQTVKDGQSYIEEQVLGQLNLEINLEFPASMQNELISSREKDSELQASQPNDEMVEMEGQK